jgi:hypothetical protein
MYSARSRCGVSRSAKTNHLAAPNWSSRPGNHKPGAVFRVGYEGYEGYEGPSQFSREHRRLFGAPPRREVTALKVEQVNFRGPR